MSDIEILCSHCKRTFEMPRWVIKQIYDTMTEFTAIPKEELELFKFISPDIDVVFDVGARNDIDYKLIKPSLICHLFEPNPEIFKELQEKARDLPNMHLNNFGMSDIIGSFHYDANMQTFRNYNTSLELLPIRTIDWYVKENNINKIDFLKTDTEGWDLKVIQGAKSARPMIKYIQYEHWNDDEKYREVLEQDFDCEYIGYRNGLAMSKTLLSQGRRDEIIKYIRDNKLGDLK